jgi:GDP-mannose transporter
VLFVLSILTESSEYSTFYSDYLDPVDDEYLWGLGMGILVSSVATFAISFSTSWSMRVTTSTTYRYLKYF